MVWSVICWRPSSVHGWPPFSGPGPCCNWRMPGKGVQPERRDVALAACCTHAGTLSLARKVLAENQRVGLPWSSVGFCRCELNIPIAQALIDAVAGTPSRVLWCSCSLSNLKAQASKAAAVLRCDCVSAVLPRNRLRGTPNCLPSQRDRTKVVDSGGSGPHPSPP
jgi:hypothetical protein